MSARTAWEAAGLTEQEWLVHSLDIRIRLAAAVYMVGWSYSLSSVGFAYASPGVPKKLVGIGRQTNCSTLTASLLTAVFPDKPWTVEEYGDLQVFSDRYNTGRVDSPIDAVERMGVGERVDGPIVGRWHLVQGWRRLGSRPLGHAFLVLADQPKVLVLEASSIDNIGPRYKRVTVDRLEEIYRSGLYWAALPRV